MHGNTIKRYALCAIGVLVASYFLIFGYYHETGRCRAIGANWDSMAGKIFSKQFPELIEPSRDKEFFCAPQKYYTACYRDFLWGAPSRMFCEQYPLN